MTTLQSNGYFHSTFGGMGDTLFSTNRPQPQNGHKTRRFPNGLPVLPAKQPPTAPFQGWEYVGSTTGGTVWVHWWRTAEPITQDSFEERMAKIPKSTAKCPEYRSFYELSWDEKATYHEAMKDAEDFRDDAVLYAAEKKAIREQFGLR